MVNLLAVFIGGGIGATLRYLATITSQKIWGTTILSTFSVNIIGCFFIGLIYGLTLQKANLLPTQLKLFLTVGVLGGLTTFSTFSYEAFNYLKDGKFLHCILYISASLLIELSATYFGYILAKQI